MSTGATAAEVTEATAAEATAAEVTAAEVTEAIAAVEPGNTTRIIAGARLTQTGLRPTNLVAPPAAIRCPAAKPAPASSRAGGRVALAVRR